MSNRSSNLEGGHQGSTRRHARPAMRCISILLVCAAACRTQAPSATSSQENNAGGAAEPTNVADEPLVAIYTAGGMRPTPAEEHVILLIWPDGRATWSEKPIAGGPPYQGGHIKPAALKDALAKLEKQGLFNDETLRRAHYGPDAGYTVIKIHDGSRSLRMASWHELYEVNPKVVATAGGLTGIGNRTREEILSEQPEDYRRYRSAWRTIRETFAVLLPPAGTPIETLHLPPGMLGR